MKYDFPKTLPIWVEIGEGTRTLFQWLLRQQDDMLKLRDYVFVKARTEECLLVYCAEKQGENIFGRAYGLDFSGIFNPRECCLYDISDKLRKAADIPDDIFFPTKQDVEAEAQSEIQKYGANRVRTDWYTLLEGSGYTTRDLIPCIDRTKIQREARRIYSEGKTAEDIVYEPQFIFGKRMGQFTDEIYLLYLNHKECVVRSFAERWLKKELLRISHKRIIYGCIRDELKEIKKNSIRRTGGNE